MTFKDQIPWFATSNGIIDLQTSADFRDHRYTNNTIDNKQEDSVKDKPGDNNKTVDNVQKPISLKVVAGGLPPLTKGQQRLSLTSDKLSGPPPPPKNNELYGDILVIPPIRPKLDEDYSRVPFIQVIEV